MITLTFPSLRAPANLPVVVEFGKPQYPVYAPHRKPNNSDIVRAEKLKISPEEFVRRDTIVRNLWVACPFHVGEHLWPTTAENKKMYGRCFVRGIFKSYYDFHDNEKWPKDDVPYILTCDSEKHGTILCTSDFFQKGNHGGTC